MSRLEPHADRESVVSCPTSRFSSVFSHYYVELTTSGNLKYLELMHILHFMAITLFLQSLFWRLLYYSSFLFRFFVFYCIALTLPGIFIFLFLNSDVPPPETKWSVLLFFLLTSSVQPSRHHHILLQPSSEYSPFIICTCIFSLPNLFLITTVSFLC